ncbi:Winged helix-turn-helix DNA-binding domain protein [Acididesulfobacillus acetoxydans]|uniref:siroheme decarboxylase n=1 Tax=Acididesulfobacillus acetoxydans TaxID=1561005 RepID=A0A8S0WP75_9FIRM|nr:Lrp/AsnC family transcriptional regulator [Acididesulfobacillus acetoxydans]CAA7601754.1 Winged helix-turn-helix DNA-binding domain protein [Acididesulfobacillus acetoxydans]CEJ09027.1 Transcriptional regulator [Acididesulfobacillus acetoxydans]
MEKVERSLLNIVQTKFPLESRPYRKLGELLGIDEAAAFGHMNRLYAAGIVRRLGGIFDSRRLGYFSTLCAAKIPADKVAQVAGLLADIPGVTHNYLREHEYNMWFTLIVSSEEEAERILAGVREEAGTPDIYSLPAVRLFKIRVDLDLNSDDVAETPEAPHRPAQGGAGWEKFPPEGESEREVMGLSPPGAAESAGLTEADRALVKTLQTDLPHALKPFALVAETLGRSEKEVLSRTEEFLQEGIMRRFGVILRHQKAGFTANAMGVWQVEEDRAVQVGKQMAKFREVSHCYQRPTLPDWPYNIFTMVHGRTPEECRRVMEKISRATGLKGYRMLFSTVELKKSSMQYFGED